MRTYLKKGTLVRLPDGMVLNITGDPIGQGGGSIIYPVSLRNMETGIDELSYYVLKECYPVSNSFVFERTPEGQIRPAAENDNVSQASSYLATVKKMMLTEKYTAQKIYQTGFRLVPMISGADHAEVSMDGGKTFGPVENTYCLMESLADKGNSLDVYLRQGHELTALQALHIVEQILYALAEVHAAGFLHLDIQTGNVFIKGSLEQGNDLATLIDFGSARRLLEDGACEAVEDCALFSTAGFTAPEILSGNNGKLRLKRAADLYSVGCILYCLLAGKRVRPSELSRVADGKYLSLFRLRKLKCPGHLTNTLQNILARSLAGDPDLRYQTCEEMLKDVSELAESLAPYRSDLHGVKYDAFISYKHGVTDSNIAKLLQQDLEHFRGGKIKRVFMDEGELAACSDFTIQIHEALKNSGFLIVICSEETRRSKWVELEITTFLKYHDRSRILVLMTGQKCHEPEDLLPTILLDPGEEIQAENVLAADARGDSLPEVRTRLKKDALLRLAAPILGVSYDRLRHRRLRYMLRRILLGGGAAALVLISFIFYLLYTNERISENYRSMVLNQAHYIVSEADRLDQNGDRLTAALIVEHEAHEILKNKVRVPEIEESLSVLTEAYLNPYQWSGLNEFAMVSMSGDIADARYYPEYDRLLTIDEYGTLLISQPGKNIRIASYHHPDMTQRFRAPVSDLGSGQVLVDAGNGKWQILSLDQGTVVRNGTYEGSVISLFALPGEDDHTGEIVEVSTDSEESRIRVYDQDYTSLQRTIDIRAGAGDSSGEMSGAENKVSLSYIEDIFVSEDGRHTAITGSDGENLCLILWNTADDTAETIYLSGDKSALDCLRQETGSRTNIHAGTFDEEGNLYIYAATNAGEGRVACLTKEGHLLWEYPLNTRSGAINANLVPDGDLLILSAGSFIRILDRGTGEEINAIQAASSVVSVEPIGGEMFLAYESVGIIQEFSESDPVQEPVLLRHLDASIRIFRAYNRGSKEYPFIRMYVTGKECRLETDDIGDYDFISLEDSVHETAADDPNSHYFQSGFTYRDHLFLLDTENELFLVDTEENRVLWQAAFPDEVKSTLYDAGLSEDDQYLYMASDNDHDAGWRISLANGEIETISLTGNYFDSQWSITDSFFMDHYAAAILRKDQERELALVNLDNHEILYSVRLEDAERYSLNLEEIDGMSSDHKQLVYSNKGQIYLASLAKGQVRAMNDEIFPDHNTRAKTHPLFAADPKTGVMVLFASDTGGHFYGNILKPGKSETVRISTAAIQEESVSGIFFHEEKVFAVLESGSVLCVSEKDGQRVGLYPFDASGLNHRAQLSCQDLDDHTALLSDGDNCMLVDTTEWKSLTSRLQNFTADLNHRRIYSYGSVREHWAAYGIYYYPLYTLEELTDKSRALLGSLQLNETDKAIYGFSE